MDSDGSNEVNLTNTSWNDFDPSWDPDGSRIVFSGQANGPEDLYFLDPGTRVVTPFRLFGTDEWHPVFSTDENQIVFTSDPDLPFEADLFIVNADGTGSPSRLTPDNNDTDDDAEFKKPTN